MNKWKYVSLVSAPPVMEMFNYKELKYVTTTRQI